MLEGDPLAAESGGCTCETRKVWRVRAACEASPHLHFRAGGRVSGPTPQPVPRFPRPCTSRRGPWHSPPSESSLAVHPSLPREALGRQSSLPWAVQSR